MLTSMIVKSLGKDSLVHHMDGIPVSLPALHQALGAVLAQVPLAGHPLTASVRDTVAIDALGDLAIAQQQVDVEHFTSLNSTKKGRKSLSSSCPIQLEKITEITVDDRVRVTQVEGDHCLLHGGDALTPVDVDDQNVIHHPLQVRNT